MITSISIQKNDAAPYLMGSSLMSCFPSGIINFSTDKPNLLVGPNGTGKSALMKTLALQTLSYSTGFSAFDDEYVAGFGHLKHLWGKSEDWQRNWVYMPGVHCEGDLGPAAYFRPGLIPGDNTSLTHAMMCGYSELARCIADRVDNKSSGQGVQNMLEHVLEVMQGQLAHDKYEFVNWRHKKTLIPREDRDYRMGELEQRAEELKAKYLAMKPGAVPLVLLDEPEQSLDIHAQLRFWTAVQSAARNNVQTIIATHSVIPLMEPENFNFIETSPGYLAEAMALMTKG